APPPPDGLTWRELPASGRMTVVRSTTDELALAVDYDGAGTTITFAPAGTGGFSAVLAGTARDGQAAYLRVRADGDRDEGFYGLGEWGDAVMHRGKLRPMQMEVDTTSESGDIENHVPVPL